MITEIDQGQLCLECNHKCSGFEPHPWRDLCTNCRCSRDSHDIRFKDYVAVNERLQLDTANMQRLQFEKTKKLASLEKGFTWQPSGLSPQEIDLFFENYPANNIPKLGTYGEKWREKALMHQMPKQDIAKEFCKFLVGDLSVKRYNDFVQERNSTALDIGMCFKNKFLDISCRYCKDYIELDSIYVHSSAVNNDEAYESAHNIDKDIEQNNFHSACFRCSVCDELLVDLVYCMKNNTLYCVRHYAETIKPRCLGCDEVQF